MKLLSICIPAYNRPIWLGRALKSIIDTDPYIIENIEIIISDDSTIETCSQVVREILGNWKGNWKYTHNNPRLGMAENWNNVVNQASGKYILILHDDDFLVKDLLKKNVNYIDLNQDRFQIFLFGVHVVNEEEKLLRKQIYNREFYLQPEEALRKLISNSSFVRFPGLVTRREAFQKLGVFNTEVGSVADLEMWIRLFGNLGVQCVPQVIAAYTVHSQALTMQMFNAEVVNKLFELFKKVGEMQILEPNVLEKCQSQFIHQFILAGIFRNLRRGNLDNANQILKLFQIDKVNQLKTPWKWRPVKGLFELAIWSRNEIKRVFNSQ